MLQWTLSSYSPFSSDKISSIIFPVSSISLIVVLLKIEAHTDSRGRDKFNMRLSNKRAKSTRDYILSRGISPDRIKSAIGFGESQLLNKCSNDVKCTPEEHQINRRSYFYIVKK